MSPTMALFTFINAWFIMMFFVIPFAIERPKHSATRSELDYAAAPTKIHWRRFLLINTVLAALATAVLALLVGGGVVPLHNWL